MRMMLQALLAALLIALVSGCLSSAEHTTLIIDFGGHRADGPQTVLIRVRYDPDARPTAPQYAQHGGDHEDYYTAFDQMEQALVAAGIPFEVVWNRQLRDFDLERIGDVPGLPGHHWTPWMGGEFQPGTLGSIEVKAGQVLVWNLTETAPMPEEYPPAQSCPAPWAGMDAAASPCSQGPSPKGKTWEQLGHE